MGALVDPNKPGYKPLLPPRGPRMPGPGVRGDRFIDRITRIAGGGADPTPAPRDAFLESIPEDAPYFDEVGGAMDFAGNVGNVFNFMNAAVRTMSGRLFEALGLVEDSGVGTLSQEIRRDFGDFANAALSDEQKTALLTFAGPPGNQLLPSLMRYLDPDSAKDPVLPEDIPQLEDGQFLKMVSDNDTLIAAGFSPMMALAVAPAYYMYKTLWGLSDAENDGLDISDPEAPSATANALAKLQYLKDSGQLLRAINHYGLNLNVKLHGVATEAIADPTFGALSMAGRGARLATVGGKLGKGEQWFAKNILKSPVTEVAGAFPDVGSLRHLKAQQGAELTLRQNASLGVATVVERLTRWTRPLEDAEFWYPEFKKAFFEADHAVGGVNDFKAKVQDPLKQISEIFERLGKKFEIDHVKLTNAFEHATQRPELKDALNPLEKEIFGQMQRWVAAKGEGLSKAFVFVKGKKVPLLKADEAELNRILLRQRDVGVPLIVDKAQAEAVEETLSLPAVRDAAIIRAQELDLDVDDAAFELTQLLQKRAEQDAIIAKNERVLGKVAASQERLRRDIEILEEQIAAQHDSPAMPLAEAREKVNQLRAQLGREPSATEVEGQGLTLDDPGEGLLATRARIQAEPEQAAIKAELATREAEELAARTQEQTARARIFEEAASQEPKRHKGEVLFSLVKSPDARMLESSPGRIVRAKAADDPFNPERVADLVDAELEEVAKLMDSPDLSRGEREAYEKYFHELGETLRIARLGDRKLLVDRNAALSLFRKRNAQVEVALRERLLAKRTLSPEEAVADARAKAEVARTEAVAAKARSRLALEGGVTETGVTVRGLNQTIDTVKKDLAEAEENFRKLMELPGVKAQKQVAGQKLRHAKVIEKSLEEHTALMDEYTSRLRSMDDNISRMKKEINAAKKQNVLGEKELAKNLSKLTDELRAAKSKLAQRLENVIANRQRLTRVEAQAVSASKSVLSKIDEKLASESTMSVNDGVKMLSEMARGGDLDAAEALAKYRRSGDKHELVQDALSKEYDELASRIDKVMDQLILPSRLVLETKRGGIMYVDPNVELHQVVDPKTGVRKEKFSRVTKSRTPRRKSDPLFRETMEVTGETEAELVKRSRLAGEMNALARFDHQLVDLVYDQKEVVDQIAKKIEDAPRFLTDLQIRAKKRSLGGKKGARTKFIKKIGEAKEHGERLQAEALMRRKEHREAIRRTEEIVSQYVKPDLMDMDKWNDLVHMKKVYEKRKQLRANLRDKLRKNEDIKKALGLAVKRQDKKWGKLIKKAEKAHKKAAVGLTRQEMMSSREFRKHFPRTLQGIHDRIDAFGYMLDLSLDAKGGAKVLKRAKFTYANISKGAEKLLRDVYGFTKPAGVKGDFQLVAPSWEVRQALAEMLAADRGVLREAFGAFDYFAHSLADDPLRARWWTAIKDTVAGLPRGLKKARGEARDIGGTRLEASEIIKKQGVWKGGKTLNVDDPMDPNVINVMVQHSKADVEIVSNANRIANLQKEVMSGRATSWSWVEPTVNAVKDGKARPPEGWIRVPMFVGERDLWKVGSRDMYFPQPVAKAIRNELMGTKKEPRGLAQLAQVWDFFNKHIESWFVLSSTPTFVRQVFGATNMAWVGGVDVNTFFPLAAKVMAEEGGTLVTRHGVKYTYDDIRRYLTRYELDEDLSFVDLAPPTKGMFVKFRKFLNSLPPILIPGTGKIWTEKFMMRIRTAHFMDALSKGMKPGEAADEVLKYHLDFRGKTFGSFEKNVLSRLTSFYKYFRRNLPLQMKLMFGSGMGGMKGYSQVAKWMSPWVVKDLLEGGQIPDELAPFEGSMTIQLARNVHINPEFMFEQGDLITLLENPSGFIFKAFGPIGIKTLFETGTNFDYFKGREIIPHRKTLDPRTGKPATFMGSTFLGNLFIGGIGQRAKLWNQWSLDKRHIHLLRMFRFSSEISKLTADTEHARLRPFWERMLNLFGTPASLRLDPKVRRRLVKKRHNELWRTLREEQITIRNELIDELRPQFEKGATKLLNRQLSAIMRGDTPRQREIQADMKAFLRRVQRMQEARYRRRVGHALKAREVQSPFKGLLYKDDPRR